MQNLSFEYFVQTWVTAHDVRADVYVKGISYYSVSYK